MSTGELAAPTRIVAGHGAVAATLAREVAGTIADRGFADAGRRHPLLDRLAACACAR